MHSSEAVFCIALHLLARSRNPREKANYTATDLGKLVVHVWGDMMQHTKKKLPKLRNSPEDPTPLYGGIVYALLALLVAAHRMVIVFVVLISILVTNERYSKFVSGEWLSR